MLRHSLQVLSSQIDVEKNFCVLWLCDCGEDSHELSISLSADIFDKVLALPIDSFEHFCMLGFRFILVVEYFQFLVQLFVEAIEVAVKHVIRVVLIVIISTALRLALIVWLGQVEAVLAISSQFMAFGVMFVMSLRFRRIHFVESILIELKQILLDYDLRLHFLELVRIKLIAGCGAVVLCLTLMACSLIAQRKLVSGQLVGHISVVHGRGGAILVLVALMLLLCAHTVQVFCLVAEVLVLVRLAILILQILLVWLS